MNRTEKRNRNKQLRLKCQSSQQQYIIELFKQFQRLGTDEKLSQAVEYVNKIDRLNDRSMTYVNIRTFILNTLQHLMIKKGEVR